MEETQQDNSLHFLDYWRVIRSRKEIILAVALLVVLTGAGVTFILPRIFMSQCVVSVKQDVTDIDVFERQMVPGYNPFFLRTQYETIKSRPILYEVIRNLNLNEVWGKEMGEDGKPLRKEQTILILENSISIEQFRDTTLIAIKSFREDPVEAARIANEIAQVYKDNRLSVKRREIKRAIDALKNELQKQKNKVDDAENEMERIRKKLGVSMVARGIRADKVRLQQLEADRISARVDMLVRKSRFDQLSELDGTELINAALYIVQDPMLMNTRQRLMDVTVQLELVQESYGENHPEVRRLVASQIELQSQLKDALEGLKKGLRADYEVSQEKFETLEMELNAAREKDIDAEGTRFLPFDKAERTMMVQRSILDALRARFAQEGIELEIPRTPVEIIDPAEPALRPISPKLYMNIIISVILGLVSGIGLA